MASNKSNQNNQETSKPEGSVRPEHTTAGAAAAEGTGAVGTEERAAKQRYLLQLERKARPGEPHITHLGYRVGKKLIEVPINGEEPLEVSKSEYEAITSEPLREGYAWGNLGAGGLADTMAAGTSTTPTGQSTSPVQPNTGSAGQ